MQRRGIQPEWSFDVDIYSSHRDQIALEVDKRKEQYENLECELVDFEAEKESIVAAIAILSSAEERWAARTSAFLSPYDEIMKSLCEILPRSQLENTLHDISGRIERNKKKAIEILAALEIAKADLERVETIMRCPSPRRLKAALNPAYIF